MHPISGTPSVLKEVTVAAHRNSQKNLKSPRNPRSLDSLPAMTADLPMSISSLAMAWVLLAVAVAAE